MTKIYNTLLRLYALNKLDIFKNCIAKLSKELIEDERYTELKNKIFANEKTHIELPNNFEYLFHRGILVILLSKSGSIEPDWKFICKDLSTNFLALDLLKNKTNKMAGDNIQIDMKSKAGSDLYTSIFKTYDEKSEFIILLLKKVWYVLDKFFKIDKYGFPSGLLACMLMNMIIGNESLTFSEPSPYTYRTNDLYELKKDIKIMQLERMLMDKGIEINEDYWADNEDIEHLDRILNIYEEIHIRFDASFYKERTKEKRVSNKKEAQYISLREKMVDVLKYSQEQSKYYFEIIDRIPHKFEDYISYIDKYIGDRFNYNMKLEEIGNKDLTPHIENVSRIINDIVEITGIDDNIN